MIKHSTLAAIAAACALPLAASAMLLPSNCPEPFDLNLDGISDAFQVGADATTAEVISGAQGGALLHALSTGDASREFTGAAAAFSVQTPGVPTVAAGLQVNATLPLGAAIAIDPVTGAIDWMIPGAQGCTVGGAVEAIADQDGDGVCDLLTAADEGTAQSAMLISGGRGTVLAMRQGTLAALAGYATVGGRLYAPEDLDDSGLVDSADIDLFFSYLSGNDPQADINGDGAADGTDFVAMVNAYQQGLTTVMSLGTPPGIAGGGIESNPNPNLPMPLPADCTCPEGTPPAGCTLQMTLECGLGALVRPGSVAMIRPTFKDAAGAVIDWSQLPQGEWCYEKLSGPEGSIVSGGIITSPVAGGVSARVRFAYRLPNGDLCCLTAECGVSFGYDCLPPECIDLAPCDLTRAVNSAGELWVSACTDGDNGPWDPAGWTYEWTVTAEGGGPSLSVPMIWWEGPYAFFETTNETTATAENVPSTNRVRVHVRVMTECGPVEAECLFDVLGDQDQDGLNDTLEIMGGCPDPANPDSDGDGFPDGSEKLNQRCDPANFPDIITDSDNDGLPDYYEGQPVVYDPLGTQHPRRPDGSPFPPPRPQAPRGTNRYDFDSDDDNASDLAESELGLDPLNALSNASEPRGRDGVTIHSLRRHEHGVFQQYLEARGYSHSLVDQDKDGLPDSFELLVGLDPEAPDQGPASGADPTDTDKDGLTDSLEARLGLSASNPDSDRDGVLDGDEIAMGLDAHALDSDSDGVPDGAEDHDNDGLHNNWERPSGTDPSSHFSAATGMCDGSSRRPHYYEAACPDPNILPGCSASHSQCMLIAGGSGAAGSWMTLDGNAVPLSSVNETGTHGIASPLVIPLSSGTHSLSYSIIGFSSPFEGTWLWIGSAYLQIAAENGGTCTFNWGTPSSFTPEDILHNTGRMPRVECMEPSCWQRRIVLEDWRFTPAAPRLGLFKLVLDQDNDDGYKFPPVAPGNVVESQLPSDRPGKLIWVASGDSDVDGIPDYADGFGILDSPEYSNDVSQAMRRFDQLDYAAQLVPLTVCLPDDVGPTDQLSVVYSLSDPHLIQPEAGEPFKLPQDGVLRVWTAPWSRMVSGPQPSGLRDPNNNSVRDTSTFCPPAGTIYRGRVLVRPGTYTLAQLGLQPGDQTTWYVEAVRPSESAGDVAVAVSLIKEGHSPVTKVAQFTAIESQFVTYDADAGVELSAGPEFAPQDPRPEVAINVVGAILREDGGMDVTINWHVKDRLSEIIEDTALRVQSVAFYANGAEIGRVEGLPGLSPTQANPPFQPFRLEASGSGIYTIPAETDPERPGHVRSWGGRVVVVNAQTSANAAGNVGWDRATISCGWRSATAEENSSLIWIKPSFENLPPKRLMPYVRNIDNHLEGSGPSDFTPLTCRFEGLLPAAHAVVALEQNRTVQPLATFTYSPPRQYPVVIQQDGRPRILLITTDELPLGLEKIGPDNVQQVMRDGELVYDIVDRAGNRVQAAGARIVTEECARGGDRLVIGESSGPLTREVLFSTFEMLYGDAGVRLFGYYHAAGHEVQVTNLWWPHNNRYDVDILTGGPGEVAQIDRDLDPVQAAQYLSEVLEAALAYTSVRNQIDPNLDPDAIETFERSYRQAVTRAAELVSSVAELYFSAVSIAGAGAEFVFDVTDLVAAAGDLADGDGVQIASAATIGNVVLPRILAVALKNVDSAVRPMRQLRIVARRDGRVTELVELNENTLRVLRDASRAGNNEIAFTTLRQLPLAKRETLAARGVVIKPAAWHDGLRKSMLDPDRLIKPIPSDLKNHAAHHMLPYKFRAKFAARGLDVNDPRFGAWVKTSRHQSRSPFSNNEFNAAWAAFFRREAVDGDLSDTDGLPEYSTDQILAEMERLHRAFKYDQS